jgi:cholest-4-en-3-one 26-monooxygenase
VYMLYLAANRDEEAFPDGETLDVRRKPDPMHLALGWGDHVCLGAHLARMETSVLLEELLDRFSRAEQAGEPRRLASVLQTAWTEVPVRLS